MVDRQSTGRPTHASASNSDIFLTLNTHCFGNGNPPSYQRVGFVFVQFLILLIQENQYLKKDQKPSDC